MSKDLITKPENAIVEEGLFEGEISSGFEGTDSETFKTPFLKILQALSPELKKNDPKYIPGAESGMFCNSATQELYENIDVIVLKVEHSLLVWRPDRGGFAGRHSKSEEDKIVVKREGVYKWDSEGNDVDDTIEFFCINANNPSDIFILALSKASIKHAKTFATRLRMLKANGKNVNVSWAGVWKLSVVEESNDKGTWFTIAAPEFQRFINMEEKNNIIEPAKEMLKSAETDYSQIESTNDESSKDDDVEF